MVRVHLSDKDKAEQILLQSGGQLAGIGTSPRGQLPGISYLQNIPEGVSLLESCKSARGQLAGTGGQSGMEWGVNGGRNSYNGEHTFHFAIPTKFPSSLLLFNGLKYRFNFRMIAKVLSVVCHLYNTFRIYQKTGRHK